MTNGRTLFVLLVASIAFSNAMAAAIAAPDEPAASDMSSKPHPLFTGQKHVVRQLNGDQSPTTLPAEAVWVNKSWNGERAALPFMVYMPEKDRLMMIAASGPVSYPSFHGAVTTSDDHGKTWSQRRWLSVDGSGKPNTSELLGLTYLGQGRLMAFAGDLKAIGISSDFGQTWRIAKSKASSAWFWDPPMIEKNANGQIQRLTFGCWKPTGVASGSSEAPYCQGYLQHSLDEGKTWSDPIKVPQWLGVNEVNIIVAPNGDWMAACRTDLPKRFAHTAFDHYGGLGVSLSKDQGKTWSDVKPLYEWGRHHPSMAILPDGRIVMSYIARMGYPDTADGFRQFGVEAVVSRDNGQTWDLPHRYVLADWVGNLRSAIDAQGIRHEQTYDWYCGPQCSSTVALSSGEIITAFAAGFRTMPGDKKEVMDVAVIRWRADSDVMKDRNH